METSSNVKVCLEFLPAVDREILWTAVPYVDIVFVGLNDGAAYTGKTDALAVVKAFLELGTRNVVVHMGERGLILGCANDDFFRISAFPTKIVDPTGQGIVWRVELSRG